MVEENHAWNKAIAIAKKLLPQTLMGELQWQALVDLFPSTRKFQVRLQGGNIRIESDENPPVYYTLSILTSADILVESYEGRPENGVDENFNLLETLSIETRKYALGTANVIDDLLSELGT